jgi:hypothetical protein
MRRRTILLCTAAISLTMGCTTLRVSKVEYAADGTEVDPQPGVRYSLPKPALKVTPRADGTIDVEVVHLPDRDRTYAIRASSWAAKHKLEIGVARGLLQKIAWSPDATAVTTQAVESGAAAGKRLLDAAGFAASAPSSGGNTAPGPVFYAINERAGTPPTLTLIAAEFDPGKKQKSFRTVTLGQRQRPTRPRLTPRDGLRPRLPRIESPSYRSAEHAVRFAEARLETLKKSGGTAAELRKAEVSLATAREQLAVRFEEAHRFEVDSDIPLYRLGSSYLDDVPECRILEPDDGPPVRCRLQGSAVVAVELPAALPDGSYRLEINYVYRIEGREREGTAEIGFDVEQPTR